MNISDEEIKQVKEYKNDIYSIIYVLNNTNDIVLNSREITPCSINKSFIGID